MKIERVLSEIGQSFSLSDASQPTQVTSETERVQALETETTIESKKKIVLMLTTLSELCVDPAQKQQVEYLKRGILFRLNQLTTNDVYNIYTEEFVNRTKRYLNDKIASMQKCKTDFNEQHQSRLAHASRIETQIKTAEIPKRSTFLKTCQAQKLVLDSEMTTYTAVRHTDTLKRMQEGPDASFFNTIERVNNFELLEGYIVKVLKKESSSEPVFQSPIFPYPSDGFVFSGELGNMHSRNSQNDILFENYIRCPHALDRVIENGQTADVIITGGTEPSLCRKFRTAKLYETAKNAAVIRMAGQTLNRNGPLASIKVYERPPVLSWVTSIISPDTEVPFLPSGNLASMRRSTSKKIVEGDFVGCESVGKTSAYGIEYDVEAIVVGTRDSTVCAEIAEQNRGNK